MLEIQEKEFEKVRHLTLLIVRHSTYSVAETRKVKSYNKPCVCLCFFSVQVCDCDDGAASVHH